MKPAEYSHLSPKGVLVLGGSAQAAGKKLQDLMGLPLQASREFNLNLLRSLGALRDLIN